MKLISLTILLFFITAIYSQQEETVIITLVRKKVQAIVGEETKIPKIGDELPLSAKVQSEGMGYLEFQYKGSRYRIGKNTSILISEVINSNAETGITNSGGVRAQIDDPESKPNFGTDKTFTNKKKPKKKKSEEK